MHLSVLPQRIGEDLPGAVAQAVGGRGATLIETDAHGATTSLVCNHFTPGFFARYLGEGFDQHDIWRQAMVRTRTFNTATPIEMLVPTAQYLRSMIYNDLVRPEGDDTAYCVAASLQLSRGQRLAIGVTQPKGAAFAEDAAARLGALLGPIRILYEMRSELANAHEGAALREIMLDGLTTAVLIVAANRAILYMNKAGEHMCAHEQLAEVRQGRLRLPDADADAALGLVLRRQGKGRFDLMIRQITAQDGTRAYLRASPIKGLSNGALVLEFQLLSGPQAFTQAARRLFGFSNAESEVAHLLAQGRTPREVAELRCVRLSTVRSQIISLCRKAEVRRMHELVALIGRL